MEEGKRGCLVHGGAARDGEEDVGEVEAVRGALLALAHLHKKGPAGASTRRAVNAARAVATGAVAAPAAGASMPPRWAATRGSAGRARAREGAGAVGRHLEHCKKMSVRKDFHLRKEGGGRERSGGKPEANMIGQGARGEYHEARCGARQGAVGC